MRQTTVFSNSNKTLTLSTAISFEEIIRSIQQEHYSLQISAYREAKTLEQKEQILSFIPAFDLEALPGLVYAETQSEALDFSSISCLYAAWKHHSGTGYSLLLLADNFTAGEEADVVKAIAQDFSFQTTESSDTVVFSTDQEAYYNPDALPYYHFPDYTLTATEAVMEVEQSIQQPAKDSKYTYVYAQAVKQIEAQTLEFEEGEEFKLYDEPQQVIEQFRCKNIPVKKQYGVARIIAQKKILIGAAKSLHEASIRLDFLVGGDTFSVNSLTEKQLTEIFNEELEKFHEGKMQVQTVTRHGKVNPALTRNQKRSASGKLSGAVRKKKSNTKPRIEEAIATLQAEGKKATTKAISQLSGVSTATVDRYRKEQKLMNQEVQMKKAA
ncbi:hypothetical protein [Nafulsella turpanensis]|uniref:hypothetical protein n=1 Tax=Nafulsella turpanensis TaxID=1265690 RepID=UPI00034CA6C3|nr:hypothetical protein [Nafulsella turpanensis]